MFVSSRGFRFETSKGRRRYVLTPVVGEAFGPIRYSSSTCSHKRSGFLSRASISPTFYCPIVRIEAIGSPKIEVYAAATLRALVFHLTSPPQLYTIILYTIQDTTCLMRTSAKLWRNTQTREASISSWIAFGQKPSAVSWCGGRKGKHIALV